MWILFLCYLRLDVLIFVSLGEGCYNECDFFFFFLTNDYGDDEIQQGKKGLRWIYAVHIFN